MDTMPNAYTVESSTKVEHTTTTTTSSNTPALGLNRSYIRTVAAILKLIQLSIDIILFICVNVSIYRFSHGGGWLNFVSSITFIVTALLFIFYLFNIIYKFPGPWVFIEFIIVIVFAVLHLIAMIVAAAEGGRSGAIIAAAVFFALNCVAYSVEAFFCFRIYRSSGGYLKNASI